jgi:hypothetical protein
MLLLISAPNIKSIEWPPQRDGPFSDVHVVALIVSLTLTLIPLNIPNLPLAYVLADLPGPEHMSLRKHFLHLLQRPPDGLGEHEEDVDEGRGVERAEDEVGLVGDGGEAGWDGEGEGGVEEPVGGGGERDGLGADLEGEDFGRVGPGDGAHGYGESRRK